jgi:hypothetical protein
MVRVVEKKIDKFSLYDGWFCVGRAEYHLKIFNSISNDYLTHITDVS